MTVVKAHRFSAAVRMRRAGSARIEGADRATIPVCVPEEFGGTEHATWSPEELVAASVASCFALTLGSVAAHRNVPLHDVDVRAVAQVERVERRYRFTRVDVHAAIETDAGRVDDAEAAAERARELCLVSNALSVPVELRLDVGARPTPRPRPGAPAPART